MYQSRESTCLHHLGQLLTQTSDTSKPPTLEAQVSEPDSSSSSGWLKMQLGFRHLSSFPGKKTAGNSPQLLEGVAFRKSWGRSLGQKRSATTTSRSEPSLRHSQSHHFQQILSCSSALPCNNLSSSILVGGTLEDSTQPNPTPSRSIAETLASIVCYTGLQGVNVESPCGSSAPCSFQLGSTS